VAFYSKNLLSTKCNYEIYDKELLAIVRCLERWRPNLKTIDISIEVFTNHKNLEYFITNKKLTCRQARWVEKLSKFNFKIMYQSGTRNAKANALTRKPNDSSTTAKDDRIRYQHQTILTSNRLSINCIEPNANVSIYDRIRKANIDSVIVGSGWPAQP
jgi:hypothetical protein